MARNECDIDNTAALETSRDTILQKFLFLRQRVGIFSLKTRRKLRCASCQAIVFWKRSRKWVL